MEKTRTISKVLRSKPVIEGAGVHLKRAFGFSQVPLFDPFLLLDDFRSDNPQHYIKGFPWHPHRGIETITYVLEGHVEHGDSMGNKGVIKSGDVQWMTAGSGIIHQEMPKKYTGLMQGFQLWVNLPASKKMIAPKYRGIEKKQIPIVQTNGAKIKVIAGKIGDTTGPVQDLAINIEYFDMELAAGKAFEHSVPTSNTVFVYVVEGSIEVGGREVLEGHCAILGEGGSLTLASSKGSRFLFVSGEPIKEPVAWRGPIVMNTEEELNQAFKELELGTFIKIKTVLDPEQKIEVM